MKPRSQSNQFYGFTLVELLVVIAVVAVLAAMLMPGSHIKSKARMAQCMSNLRQIGLANSLWANDNKTNFPSLVSTNQAGTMEYVAGGQLDLHCQALESYLPSPSVFWCSTDTRKPATNYATLKNGNISYFTSLDAAPTNSNLFLAGDRNLIINNNVALAGLASLTAKSSARWSEDMHNKQTGQRRGIVVFPDGHAEATSEARLSALTASLGMATNRLVFP